MRSLAHRAKVRLEYEASLSDQSEVPGKVAEWSNAPDSKSGIQVSCIEGSNPSLSASEGLAGSAAQTVAWKKIAARC